MTKSTNKKIIAVVVGIAILGAGFGAGLTYAKMTTRSGFAMGGTFGGAQFATRSGAGMGATGATRGGNFIAGEILSRDASGVTIKMQDGSTKIILVGTSAQINKNEAGTIGDLIAGTNITVTGITNSDGSVTAQAIQLRPAGMGSTTPRQ